MTILETGFMKIAEKYTKMTILEADFMIDLTMELKY